MGILLCFAVRMNTLQGTIDPNAVRDATVIGTEYLWDLTARSQTASLLWTTTEPFTPTIGWTGSVLCLGRPTDQVEQGHCFSELRSAVLFFYRFSANRKR